MKKIIAFLLSFLILIFFSKSAINQAANKEGKAKKRPSVGLVLSGGGAKGFAYIGLLKVIQEAGLPIDYIGGASIGSIIGGMYAIGYHPDTIAEIIREQNWDHLLKDIIDRKYISFEEKEYGEKFIVTLPVKDKKVAISPSLYQGQEINMMLNRYFSPAYQTSDFTKLQTPFFCISTDLLSGNEVMLQKGNLAQAIRSSMAIPGYFSPVDYEGYYLVDGGVVNNYPARNMHQLGVDIIVGGDVQFGLSKTREELKSLTAILDQIISYHRVEANEEGYALTDLYVHIPLKFSMMDFGSYDSIIAVGEKVGRQYFDQIKALADSLNEIEYKPIKKYETVPLDSIPINEVRIEGNKKMPARYFENIFDDFENTKISMNDLEKYIRHLYGTRFFKEVGYELEAGKDGRANLIIHAPDADPGYLSAGIHYDNNYHGSVLINGSFRNVLGKRTKLFADLILGLNPRARLFYLLDNGNKPGYGVRLEYYHFTFDDYDKDVKVNKFDFNNFKAAVFMNTSLKNFVNFRLGFEYEYFQFKQDVVTDTTLEKYSDFNSYGNVFARFSSDTRDRNYFSSRGSHTEIALKYILPLSSNWSKELFTNSAIFYFKFDQNIPLSKRFTLRPGVFFGTTIKQKQEPPVQHWFGLGGQNPDNYVDTHVDFTGVKFIQSFGYHAWVGRLKLQYNFVKKMFLTLRSDVGANQLTFQEAFHSENIMFGYGLSYGYDSFVGPIEITIMGSNMNPKPIIFLNLGFWL